MAKNILVINVDIRETRVALIENGIIAELHIERESSKGTLGNIYLGKVSRVLPGMQAAFIDVGLERAAFLHVEDLIRPDDFEAYLAGNRRAAGATGGDEDRGSAPSPEDAVEGADADAAAAAAAALVTERGEDPDAPESQALDPQRVEIHVPPAEPSGEGAAGRSSADDDEPLLVSGSGADEEDHDHDHDHESDDIDVDVDDDDDDDDGRDEPATTRDEPETTRGEAPAPLEEPETTRKVAIGRDEGEVAPPAAAASASASGPTEGAIEGATQPSQGAGTTAGTTDAKAEGGLAEAVGEDGLTTASRTRVRKPRGAGREARVRRSGRTTDRRPDAAADPARAANGVAVAKFEGPTGTEVPRTDAGGGGRGDAGGRRNDRGRGRRGGGREGQGGGGREGQGGGGREGREARGGSSKGGSRSSRQHEPPRVSKTTPIRDVVREGQEVIVQITKEPIGTKGARVSSHISLPGRYVVYLPTVDHIGISKRIGSEKERQRLRESIDAMKPPTGGLIVRTLAEGLTKKQLKSDVGYLVRLWGEIAKKRETAERAPTPLYTELDLVTKTARDLFSDDIEKIVIDDREQYNRLKRFVEMFMPERADAVEYYDGEEPIFDAYGIEDEIGRALSRKVPLASGGHLIIDQAEALTAIDVNTGRYVGKGSKDLEDTILTTNLEAVEEIAYQLRFRNIGGLIILDLIDMDRAGNREKVRKKMEQLLAKDKAKTTLNRISDLGLIEMTRKRTRESLGRTIHEPCFYCDGTGQLQSKQTIAYEILRQIRRERANLRGYSVVVNAHPAVVDYMKNDERSAVREAEQLFTRRIELVARKEYHLEQFDLLGK